MITLYHCNTSLASQKVRVCLAEKKLPWKSHHIDLRKQEQITSDYRKINPKGTVPAMKNEKGEIICGSTDIIEYIESHYRNTPLWPDNFSQRRKIHQFCLAQEALHDPSLRTLSYINIFMSPEKRKTMDVEHVLKLAKQHPYPARGEFITKVLENRLPQEEIDACENAVIQSLEQMESMLTASKFGFLIGGEYSFADSVATASVYRIKQVGMEDNIEQHSQLNIWWQAMQQRPSFHEAIAQFYS